MWGTFAGTLVNVTEVLVNMVFPVLLFLGLFENTKQDLKNTKDFSHHANPQKPSVKQTENTQKDQGNSQGEKDQGNENTKEKKDKVVGSPNFAKVRQSSHEGVRMLLVDLGTCLN